jgi:hypothetical protein
VRAVTVVERVPQRLAGLHLSFRSFYFWLVCLTAAGMGLGLIRALAPPHGATDPLAYQLALPKIFLHKHYLSFEPTITGALYPTNMGLLYLVGLALRSGSLAQILHWAMGGLTCLALVGLKGDAFGVLTGQLAVVARDHALVVHGERDGEGRDLRSNFFSEWSDRFGFEPTMRLPAG